MTLENEKRFLLLMSSFYLGNSPTKASVLDNIVKNDWIILSDKDISIKQNRNELVWRNNLAFVKKHLVLNGFYNAGQNDWGITETGKIELKRLCGEIMAEYNLKKVSYIAKKEAETVIKLL